MVYGHANGRDHRGDDRGGAALRRMGYKAIRLQAGVPGLASDLRRVAGQDVLRAGRCGAADAKTSGRRPSTCASRAELFAAAREALGWDIHLLHDVHHRLTPIEAARLGKDLEPYRLFWMEDAVPAENQESSG